VTDSYVPPQTVEQYLAENPPTAVFLQAARPLAYTVQQAAAAVGLSERFIRARLTDGSIRGRMANSKPLIPADELDLWLKSLPSYLSLTPRA
jgi:excisionase family DNA binding protein